MFSILGVRKHKERGALVQRASHHLRGHAVQNADPARAHLNATSWRGGAPALVDEIWARTEPAMQRKDGIRVVEVMLTASPEWFDEGPKGSRLEAISKGARSFLAETFGLENVVASGLHLDEKTPHIWAFVTPIFEGKLRASRWLDGAKKLAQLHTKWAEKMQPFGLVRGAEKSTAKHIDIRTYYSAVNGNSGAQETIAREMARRAASAKMRADLADQRVAEIEAREARSRSIHDALSQVEQERATELFSASEATKPSPTPKKQPVGPSGGGPKPRPVIRHHAKPSPN